MVGLVPDTSRVVPDMMELVRVRVSWFWTRSGRSRTWVGWSQTRVDKLLTQLDWFGHERVDPGHDRIDLGHRLIGPEHDQILRHNWIGPSWFGSEQN